MRKMMLATACLALAGCTAVSVVPTNEAGKSVKLKVTAAGSALLHKPETLIDRALEVGHYACYRLMTPDLSEEQKLKLNLSMNTITNVWGDLEKQATSVQSITESVKATLDVFGSHSLSMAVTCVD